MPTSNDYSVWVDQYVGHWLSQTTSPTTPPDPAPSYSANRKRKRVEEKGESPLGHRGYRRFNNHYSDTDTFSCAIPEKARYSEHSNSAQSSYNLPENSCQMDERSDRLTSRPLIIPRISTGTPSISVCDSPGSIASVTSKASIKRKLEALEFNGTPTLAWHLVPDDLPNPVAKLMARLTLSADGCQSIPLSLKETIESDPNLVSEAFSSFLWATSNTADITDPDPADTKLWKFVQDIVRQSRLLASQKAEESEYYSLVQKILRLDLDSSELDVKHVTTSRFNPHHLPQGPPQGSPTKRARSCTNKSTSPVLDVRVDISIEYRIPDQLTHDQMSSLPFSLLAALKRYFGSAWVFGPYPRLSVVSCLAEIKTTIAASRLEAEFQAAVGGVCMIQARIELVDMIKSLASGSSDEPGDAYGVDEALLNFNFPVLTLVIMGDTWYFQVVYLRTRGDCVVLPIRIAGDTLTHAGVFKLLKFVSELREWCLEYAREFILLLKALGTRIGWHGD